MNKLLTLALCGFLLVACCQKKQTVVEPKAEQVTEQIAKRGIHLEKEDGAVYCYADTQRVVFNDDYLDYGAFAMMLYPKDRYVYVAGDIMPNSNGWTVRYHLYRLDTLTFETKHIGDFAAIHFEDEGFKAATARLTNPDATCTAEEIYAIHDVYFNNEGQKIRESKEEYRYDEMERIYGDSLVNADGYPYK